MKSSGRNAYRTLIRHSLISMRALIIWMKLKIATIKGLPMLLPELLLETYKQQQPFKDKNSSQMKSKVRLKMLTLSNKIMKNVQT